MTIHGTIWDLTPWGETHWDGYETGLDVPDVTFDASSLFCTLINENGDNEIDSAGQVSRDYTAVSRCMFRLTCRRGEYFADENLGSRLHTIKTLKNAQQLAEIYVIEALIDLIRDGVIIDVSVGTVERDIQNGQLGIPVYITLPWGEEIDLGLITLGRSL